MNPIHQPMLANEPLLSSAATRLRGQLQAFARERLPEVMVPSRFVILPQLPKLPNGKVDRNQLPRQSSEVEMTRHFQPPTTSEEIRIAQIGVKYWVCLRSALKIVFSIWAAIRLLRHVWQPR